MTRAKKKALHAWLQTALDLELATIPPYLVALLSIRLPANRESAELIRSVMVEEMLHIALVANLMVATGAKPQFGGRITSYPFDLKFEGEAFADRTFPLELQPFSEGAIDTFLKIELPQTPARLLGADKDLVVPALTIGEFYQKILDLLDELAGEDCDDLFCGDPSWQIDEGYYWSSGGKIIRITDLATAKQALNLVIDQGEGAGVNALQHQLTNAHSHYDIGHYFRFNQIAHGRRYAAGDDYTMPPTGEPINVDYDAVFAIRPNPNATDYQKAPELERLNNQFNARYSLMLSQLDEVFAGTAVTLYTAIMDNMHELAPIAHAMMKRAYPYDEEGRVACPTFDWHPNANNHALMGDLMMETEPT
jgi:hypothetical protein